MNERESGQSLIALSALLPLVLLPLALYTVEAALLTTRQARLSGGLSQAAEDAAQQIDEAEYRASGRIKLRADLARGVALAGLAGSDPAASLDDLALDGQGGLILTAHEQVPLQVAFLWPGATVTLRSRSRAWLTVGYEPAPG